MMMWNKKTKKKKKKTGLLCLCWSSSFSGRQCLEILSWGAWLQVVSVLR